MPESVIAKRSTVAALLLAVLLALTATACSSGG